jgi:hypothetical protein
MSKPARRRNPVMMIVGALMAVFGTIFMFQGLGTIKSSSPMTNSNFWAVAGPVIAFFGVVVLVLGFWGERQTPPE